GFRSQKQKIYILHRETGFLRPNRGFPSSLKGGWLSLIFIPKREKKHKIIIFHEYSHAKLIEKIGIPEELIDSVPLSQIDSSIEEFEEFSADILAKNKISDYDFSIKLNEFTSRIGVEAAILNRPDHVVYWRAVALRGNNKAKLSIIDDALDNYPSASTKIKDLSNDFVKNSDIISKSANEQKEILNSIAKKTYSLKGG
ncbi:hypothetical protein HYY72_04165, partial [Candidatus Woesearchaeota archaeon]|nr:hypothetical protein [Candidatus Woesearchaeota archaeon]